MDEQKPGKETSKKDVGPADMEYVEGGEVYKMLQRLVFICILTINTVCDIHVIITLHTMQNLK